jgi:hypothetical protein
MLRIRIRTYVFGPPVSGSVSQRYGSGFGSGSFYHQAKKVRKTLIFTVCDLFIPFFIFEKWYRYLPKEISKKINKWRLEDH